MKRNLALLGLVLCFASVLQAQTLSAADREKAVKYLESTKQAVLGRHRRTVGGAVELSSQRRTAGPWPRSRSTLLPLKICCAVRPRNHERASASGR